MNGLKYLKTLNVDYVLLHQGYVDFYINLRNYTSLISLIVILSTGTSA